VRDKEALLAAAAGASSGVDDGEAVEVAADREPPAAARHLDAGRRSGRAAKRASESAPSR
jgi:hypothetical protein